MKFYKVNDQIVIGEGLGEEILPGVTDGAFEKHVPKVTVDGETVTVQVGEVIHPMMDAHYIEFIVLETEKGYQKVCLKPGQEPVATFKIIDDKAVAAYEYCNLHGLWKADI